ncbi:MAG: O-antigen ligase family protein [Taibaiella sp.]|nr:O-antigen ligase family protein [Taibaiella sp.]
MLAWFENKWFSLASLSVLFFAIFATAWTGSPLYLALPIGYLFVILAGVNWKTAYWIFLFTIPPSTQISLAGDTLSLTLPDQPMMWLFLAVFGLVLARNPKAIPQWWWRDSLVLVVVVQFLWTAVAVIFSKMLFFSFKFLLVKTWLLVCFFFFPLWIFREKKDFVRGFLVMLVPMLLTIIVILIHHAILGFRFDEIQHAITDLYYNHVDYSTVISMFFPLLVFTCWPLIRHRNVVMKSVLIVVILIFIAGIGFAYARAAVVAVVFALVVGVAMRLRLVNLVMPGFYALIILLMAYMVPNNRYIEFRPDYEHTFMRKNFVDHVIATFRGKDMSSMERLYRWIAAVRMSKENPVTGVGPRAFVYYYKPHAVTAFRTYVSRNPEQSTTHNYFLYMLVEQGWPAMLLYALFMLVVFYRAQKIYHRFKDKFYRCVTMGLTMTVAVGFINNFFSELIETHKVAALFYIPVALLIILDRKSKEEYAAIKRGEVPVVE